MKEVEGINFKYLPIRFVSMEIKVFVEREQKEHTVKLAEQGTAKDLLEKLKINSEAVLIIKKGDVILPETPLQDKDNIKLLSVISGG